MRGEFICNITGAEVTTDGLNPPNSIISAILTDTKGSFAKTAFQFPDEAKREMLAVALTAISNQTQVLAALDTSTHDCLLLEINID